MSHLHIDYHAILEAFRTHTERCPVCAIVRQREEQFWDSTLYGAVGTEGFQDSFLAANGFCPHHTRELAGKRDGVAVTMLYAPLLTHRRQWIDELERPWYRSLARRRPPSAAAIRGKRARTEDCLLCDQIDQWVYACARNILRHQNEADLRRAIESGRGLCVPHYRVMATIGQREHLRSFGRIHRPAAWLSAFHRTQWAATVQRAEAEALARGGVAWQDLLRVVEGDGAVPGPAISTPAGLPPR